ncbi:hypothetical protein M758_9G040300 [Ceratodon purpureus]|nr:hypothetical protein M758_9G040300 [Ceratodon purpureus]
MTSIHHSRIPSGQIMEEALKTEERPSMSFESVLVRQPPSRGNGQWKPVGTSPPLPP